MQDYHQHCTRAYLNLVAGLHNNKNPLAIDTACLSIIEPLISEGKVPSIATQYEQGIVSELTS